MSKSSDLVKSMISEQKFLILRPNKTKRKLKFSTNSQIQDKVFLFYVKKLQFAKVNIITDEVVEY